MEKIKVLHLITHLGVGGAQDNTLFTVRGHSRELFHVHLGTGLDYTDWQSRGREFADAFYVFPNLHRAAQPAADIKVLNELIRFMKQQNYQIVHTHSAKAGTLGRIAAHRAKIPVIIHTFHSFGWQVANTFDTTLKGIVTSKLKKKYYMVIERYAASLSDALITVSDLNKREALNVKLASPEKFTTIYSGIDLSRFCKSADRAHMCHKLGLSPEKPVIGTIGRLSIQKAPLDFIASAKMVLQKKPDVQFIMVGDGPLSSNVIRAIGNESRIKVFGYREDVPDILSILDAFVLSSLWEGLGRSLTEAMIMDVPVVATAVDGVPELVSHKQTGLLSPPSDPVRLADNILWLLDNPHEADHMRQSAKTKVIPDFSAEKMVEKIETLYQRLLIEKGLVPSEFPLMMLH